jgi:uncharacterized protein (DUF849 family)
VGYKTRALQVLEGSEQYALRSQIARDLGRYDFIKDIGRVESIVADRAPRARGYAILLTNDPSYWKHPRSDNTADARFRLHEGNILRGSLGWGSGASEGTKRGREDLLQLRGSYTLRWEDYSRPAGDNYGKFRYLVVEAKGGASTTIAEPSLAGTHWVHDDEEALGLGTDDYARVRAEEQCVLGLRRITRTICHNSCRHFLSTMVLSENTAPRPAQWVDSRDGGAMISTRVVLQAALNGDRTKAAHSATPVSVEELAQDAAACVAAGARAIHLHPRDPEGRETLEAVLVDEVVTKVRAACGVPVGVTTSAEIEPDPERRLGLVRAWRAPDYASVNLSEAGATKVMKALVEAGVGIEAGVWTAEDAARLAASGLSGRVTRILVEPGELQLQDSEAKTADALGLVEDIHRALDRLGLKSPRLQHGDGEVTWVLLMDAVRRGIDTRIGLEDTLRGSTGELAADNEALVRAARKLGAGTD